MKKEIAKYLQTISIAINNLMVYKVNFVLQVIAPPLIFFFIKYNIWTSIYSLRSAGEELAGYSLDLMIEYQALAMVVSLIAQGFNSRNLAEDIRLGRISTYLIYPFDFWQFHLSTFLGVQFVHIFVSLFSIALFSFFGFIPSLTLQSLALGISFSVLVGVFWFSVQFMIGLMAFWLEETWMLRVILMIVAGFFSGSIIPLEFFPDWARTIIMYTPFPYMTYIPIQIFLSRSVMPYSEAVLVILTWTFFSWLGGRFIWQRGLRLYSAAGM